MYCDLLCFEILEHFVSPIDKYFIFFEKITNILNGTVAKFNKISVQYLMHWY